MGTGDFKIQNIHYGVSVFVVFYFSLKLETLIILHGSQTVFFL